MYPNSNSKCSNSNYRNEQENTLNVNTGWRKKKNKKLLTTLLTTLPTIHLLGQYF